MGGAATTRHDRPARRSSATARRRAGCPPPRAWPTGQGGRCLGSICRVDRQPMVRLNVGCGRNILPGWINIDMAPLPGVDIVTDLEDCKRQRLPLEDGSADEFFLSHLIEHIRQPLPLMEELHRIAKPDALM